MTSSFFIPNEKLIEVKAKIRTYQSFRFEHNPIIGSYRTNIKISGDVKEMNEFDKWLETIEHNKILEV
jgi:hypothetical protein